MNKSLKVFAIGAALLATAGVSEAGAKCTNPDLLLQVLQVPPGQAKIIEEVPIAGLGGICGYVLETARGRQVIYGSKNHLILGKVIDIQKEVDVQAELLKKYQKIDVAALEKLKNMAVFTIGSGPQDVVLLTDPECPYCKKLEKALKGFEKDVTFHVLLLPLPSHRYGVAVSKQLLCEDNKPTFRTLEDFVTFSEEASKKSSLLKQKGCDDYETHITEVSKVLRSQKVPGGVPKMFYADGFYTLGAVPIEHIQRAMDAAKK